ncbi:hypothetical protein [Rhizobium sp. UBA1881]|jgi:hypothetical protein|uniref:hypothetical protein n=2 Tax=unclassified Rhizobium TaxID=2613769 RepID=UPI000DD8DD17|nr:hypothetical protein [Rhizobium sp. UBA1881]
MNEISVGAVGAAVIAGLVSLLGLVIGKEQKVSEFRQAWIDELRKCFVAYLVNINAISDALRLKSAGKLPDESVLIPIYKSLNEASHGIALRINAAESPAKAVTKAMTDFEGLAANNASLTPEKIRDVEKQFVDAAKELLKFEWNRVKRGERVFVWTKRIVGMMIFTMLCILAYALASSDEGHNLQKIDPPSFHLLEGIA